MYNICCHRQIQLTLNGNYHRPKDLKHNKQPLIRIVDDQVMNDGTIYLLNVLILHRITSAA